jgi:hypothetical protein
MASLRAWMGVAFVFTVICLYAMAGDRIRYLLEKPEEKKSTEKKVVQQIERPMTMFAEIGMSESQIRKTTR